MALAACWGTHPHRVAYQGHVQGSPSSTSKWVSPDSVLRSGAAEATRRSAAMHSRVASVPFCEPTKKRCETSRRHEMLPFVLIFAFVRTDSKTFVSPSHCHTHQVLGYLTDYVARFNPRTGRLLLCHWSARVFAHTERACPVHTAALMT